MIDLKSTLKGILCMKKTHAKVSWEITFHFFGRAWIFAWTPTWHEGRGPYISIGFYFIRICRGY
jgi:hypothetical protein